MDIVFDIILLAASTVAVIFCYILNGRLKKVRGAAKQLGVTINSLSETVNTARQTVLLAQKSSSESYDELAPLVKEAKDLAPQLTQLLRAINELEKETTNQSANQLYAQSNFSHHQPNSSSNAVDGPGSPLPPDEIEFTLSNASCSKKLEGEADEKPSEKVVFI